MAYMYDEMGNVVGEYESEEERKRREQEELANREVSKTEIKTYGDGSQEEIVKRQIPAPVAPTAQPAPVATAYPVPEPRQIVAQPISPDQTFNRMVQAESGGQQFNRQGGILTSPKGAQGMAQIMPATARQPGFGVAPATPEEIATPEGNRAFGERYFQGLLKHFNGDVAKATAAYNAGPGAVQKNVQANQGQMNTAQLPQETQGYLQKVLGGVVNAVIPSAQAGTLTEEQRRGAPTITPPAPVAQTPTPAPASTAATGLRIPSFATPGATTTTAPTPESTASIDRYQANQDNILELIKMSREETTPQWMRDRASARAVTLAREEDERNKAQQRLDDLTMRVAAGDPKASREMANELKSDGSWVKMLLLGFISPQLAGEEAMKLGFGNKDRTVYDADGNPGIVTFRADGKPLNGIKADGTPMSQRELIIYAGGGKRDLDIVGGTYVNDTTGEVGRVVSDKKTGQSYIQTDKGRVPMAGFRPQASTGSLANMRERMVQEINLKLQGKTEEEKMAILRPYNQQLVAAKYAPIDPSEVGIRAPQIASGTPAAGTTTAAVPPAAGTVTGPAVPPATATPGTLSTGQRPTGPQLKAAETQAVTEARETGEDIAKIKAGQGKAERQADYLITKMDELVKHPGFETSVGAQGASYLFGALDKPLPPQLGGGPARDWQNRAREVIGGGFVQAIEALKGLGALSDAEGKSAAAAIQRLGYMDPKTNLPVVTATEAEFRAAVKDFQEVIQRNVDGNRAKLGQKPKYGTPPESEQNAPVASPAPELSPADKARAELERRRKKQGQ